MKRYIFVVFVLIISFCACSKKEQIGPDLGVIMQPVEFEEPFAVSNASPNFNNDDVVYFTAKFKKETYWVLTITGNASGAVRKFDRASTTGLVISESNSSWDGSSIPVTAFRAEAATATLSFPYSTAAPVSLNINILGVK